MATTDGCHGRGHRRGAHPPASPPLFSRRLSLPGANPSYLKSLPPFLDLDRGIPFLPELRHGRVAGIAVAAALPTAEDRTRSIAFVAYFDYVVELGPESNGTPAASLSSNSLRFGRRCRLRLRPLLLLLNSHMPS